MNNLLGSRFISFQRADGRWVTVIKAAGCGRLLIGQESIESHPADIEIWFALFLQSLSNASIFQLHS